TAGNIQNIAISHNKITLSKATANGIHVQGISGGSIVGNVINNNQVGGNGILLDAYPVTDTTISGNSSGLGTTYNATNQMAYGIYVDAAAHTRLWIAGNSLYGSTAALANLASGSALTSNADITRGVVTVGGTAIFSNSDG